MVLETPMSKVKIVLGMSLFRFGLKHFAKEVNDLLAQGYDLEEFKYEHVWLRTFLYARLEKP